MTSFTFTNATAPARKGKMFCLKQQKQKQLDKFSRKGLSLLNDI